MKKFLCILSIVSSLLSSAFTQEIKDRTQISTADYSKDTAEINQLLRRTQNLRYVATDSAIQILFAAYNLSENVSYAEGMARSLTNLGLMYMDKGEYGKSLQLYREAIPYCRLISVTQPKGIILLYNNIAALYGNRNVFDTAAMYYYKALECYDAHKLKDTLLVLNIYNNLAARLISIERLKEAKFYLKKAKELALATHNARMLAKSYVSYSGVFGIENIMDSSRKYAQKALHIFDTVSDPASHIIAYCNLAETYLLNNQPNKALPLYLKAFEKNKNASEVSLAPAYRGLGKCYYQMKDYKKAERYYLLALEQARKINSYSGITTCYKALVDIYVALNDYKTALDYRNHYAVMADSNMNEEKIKAFSQMEVKYRTVQKDKELAQNQLLLTKQFNQLQRKNVLLITVSICALLTILLIINIYRASKQKEKLRLQTLKNEKQIEQLRAIMKGEERERIRIARELHDGIMIQFSSVKMNLSALAGKLLFSKTDKVNDIITSLDEAINDLRKSAHNLMPDMLLKEGLTEALHYFCVKLQEGTNTEIDFQSYGTIPSIASEYELMIYRMVQELLHNTLKHARAARVLVQLNYRVDMISITVEDDGKGFTPDIISLHKGMGLHQMRERIASLSGIFHIYKNKPTGSSVYIELESRYLQQTHAIVDADKSLHS